MVCDNSFGSSAGNVRENGHFCLRFEGRAHRALLALVALFPSQIRDAFRSQIELALGRDGELHLRALLDSLGGSFDAERGDIAVHFHELASQRLLDDRIEEAECAGDLMADRPGVADVDRFARQQARHFHRIEMLGHQAQFIAGQRGPRG